jgi:flagellar FliL protein
MADAAENKIAEGKDAPVPPAGIPIKLVIIIVAAAVVLGLGGAIVVFKMMSHPPQEAAAPAPAQETAAPAHGGGHDTAKATAASAGPGAIFDLEPFIVNLADNPETRYLKLTVKLEMENEAMKEEVTKRVPQVRDAILILLSSKDTMTLRSTQGKFQLKEELTARVNAVLPKGGIRSAYFTDFVVQ